MSDELKKYHLQPFNNSYFPCVDKQNYAFI